eukprot:s272_g11.t2
MRRSRSSRLNLMELASIKFFNIQLTSRMVDSNRCLLEFCFNANDSVCETATAVAARMRICLFSSGAACAVHLQTSHEQGACRK